MPHLPGISAAAAATSISGFTGDPLHPITGKYLGYLVSAVGY